MDSLQQSYLKQIICVRLFKLMSVTLSQNGRKVKGNELQIRRVKCKRSYYKYYLIE